MKRSAICFTSKGMEVIRRLNEASAAAGITRTDAYYAFDTKVIPEGFIEVKEPVSEWAGERFADGDCIIFVGAAGIAVRAVAPYVQDKLSDSPVIVIDDGASYVIPILSGHAGGANKIAQTIAALLGAVPVITTSTDCNGVFSADVYAAENNLKIANRDGVKRVSSKAIEGKPVVISIKDYPPSEPVDIVVADETDAEYELLLKPKRYVLGVGMKKNTEEGVIGKFCMDVLETAGIEFDDIYAVCTIDLKLNEPGLRRFCQKNRLPLIAFDAAVLNKAPGNYSASDFVLSTTGTDNVCERAAILGSDLGELIIPKTSGSGVTCAVALRRGYIEKRDNK